MWTNLILGAIIFSFGAYELAQSYLDSTLDTTPLWWLRTLAALVLGVGFMGWNLLPLLTKIKLSQPSKKVEEMTTELPANIVIKQEEESDVQALYYLTERCKDMPEALECLRKLNDILFTKHHATASK